MTGTTSVHQFLQGAEVSYKSLMHRPAFTAQEEAAATHVPPRDWAKVVVCFVDGAPIEAVVPAPMTVNLDRLRELARGEAIRVATEDELRRLFPECEVGAVPPIGPLYGYPVFVDVALAAELDIVFSAGTHTEAISMSWADFAATVRPIVGRFAELRHDHVGAFRLSYRE
jgi:Ala-tRNA(Pro) deacylase